MATNRLKTRIKALWALREKLEKLEEIIDQRPNERLEEDVSLVREAEKHLEKAATSLELFWPETVKLFDEN